MPSGGPGRRTQRRVGSKFEANRNSPYVENCCGAISRWNAHQDVDLESARDVGARSIRLVGVSFLAQPAVTPALNLGPPFLLHQRFSTIQMFALGEDLNVAICRPFGDGIAHSLV